jgi:capsular polysaccharide biosynthesis protein
MTRDWLPRAAEISRDLVAGTSSPVVAVILRGRHREITSTLGAELPGASIRCHEVGLGIEDLHLALAAHGPYDLVLDLAGGAGAGRRFRALFFHARAGGSVVVRRPPAENDDLAPYLESAMSLNGRAEPPTRPFDPRPRDEVDLHALAASLVDVRVLPRFVIAANSVATLAKIPERVADRYFELTDRDSSVLARVPGETWPSRSVLRGSDPDRVADMPRTFKGPALSVREHRDVVCVPHAGVYADNVVLPDTYRRRKKRLRGAAVVDWSHWFARRPDVDPAPLPGRYFHLDNEWRGHFGHAMAEQVSKLWAWERAKGDDPALRMLLLERPGHPVEPWELDLWEAAGVARDDIEVAPGPVRVERLVTGSPAYGTPEGLHPILGDTYARLGLALDRGDDDRSWPTRVFLSRRPTARRRCHNADEVEALMRGAGFEVVYPEDHPLTVQATMARRAEVIAGFSGSGMFSVALADSPTHVIVIGSESYTAINEYRLSSFIGHQVDMVWCRADRPVRGKPFFADFTYDDAREGRFLRQVLDEL